MLILQLLLLHTTTCICCPSYSRIHSVIKPAVCVQQYAYLRRGQESLRILSNPTLWPVNSVDCISLSVNIHPHCAELPLCNQAFAVGCDAWWMSSSALYFSISSSFALCPHIPSLHLVVRWKIGETLFSLFPITQNRPGLLKCPLLHLPIGTEPRISPWEKNHHN